MDALEVLLTRRSIRSFTSAPVSDGQIETLLKAAMHAPSAGNGQPWHFVVIRDRDILHAVPEFHPYAQMVPEAPAAILVCGDQRQTRYPDYWVLDCSAATENLLLAAHAIDLGAVWLGIYPNAERMEAMCKLVPLPEGVSPLALVPVGVPAEIHPPMDRYIPERVHFDRW